MITRLKLKPGQKGTKKLVVELINNRMKKSNIFQLIFSVSEFFFFAAFLVSVWQSDRALDKSGFGDIEKFAFWDKYAGLSIKLFFLLWTISIIFSLLFKRRKQFTF
jgi:hypothetical protein